MEEPLIYSRMAGGHMVFVWQVKDFTPDEFSRLREEAKEQIARWPRESQPAAPAKPTPSPQTVPEWGVVLRPAGEDLLAEKLLLRGCVVQRVLPGGSPAGLQADDVIVDYGDLHGLVMGDFGAEMAMRRLVDQSKRGGSIPVIRGDRLVRLSLKGP